MTIEEEIRRLSESLVAHVSKDLRVNLGYDKSSVEWLDGFVERIRTGMDEFSTQGLSNSIGAFLGVCIIANYGGKWGQSDDGACGIYFDNKNAAYPFAKVEKHLRNGPEDSILSFYEMIPIVFERLGKSPTNQVDVLDSQ